MDLRELEHIEPMTVGFHGLNVTFNPDAFVASFFYQAAERLRSEFAGIDKVAQEVANNGDKKGASPETVLDLVAQRIHSKGDVEAAERAYYISLLTGTSDNPVLL